MENLYAYQAAKLLGVSIDKLGILEKQGFLHSSRDPEGVILYSSEEIAHIKAHHGFTLSQEAAQIDIEIQKEMRSSVRFTKKVIILTGSVIAACIYVIFIAIFNAFNHQPNIVQTPSQNTVISTAPAK